MTDIVASRSPFIDGAFVRGDGDTFTVDRPVDRGAGRRRRGGVAPTRSHAAIAAARRAFDDGPWPRMTTDERCRRARRASPTRSSARRDLLVETVIAEAGCPRTFTRDDAGRHGPRLARTSSSSSRGASPSGSTTSCRCASTSPATR